MNREDREKEGKLKTKRKKERKSAREKMKRNERQKDLKPLVCSDFERKRN